MTTKTIKLIAFIALLVHGIGHFQGVAAGLGIKINNHNPSISWLLKNLEEKTNNKICFIIFLLTGIMGIITALCFIGLIFSINLWQIMAIITAALSSTCMILFPNSFAIFFNKIGAIVVNLFIYYSIVFSQYWPSVLFED